MLLRVVGKYSVNALVDPDLQNAGWFSGARILEAHHTWPRWSIAELRAWATPLNSPTSSPQYADGSGKPVMRGMSTSRVGICTVPVVWVTGSSQISVSVDRSGP